MGSRQNSCVLIGQAWKFRICSVQSQKLFGHIATAHFNPLPSLSLYIYIYILLFIFTVNQTKTVVANVRLVREECLLFRAWALRISFKPQDESGWLKTFTPIPLQTHHSAPSSESHSNGHKKLLSNVRTKSLHSGPVTSLSSLFKAVFYLQTSTPHRTDAAKWVYSQY